MTTVARSSYQNDRYSICILSIICYVFIVFLIATSLDVSRSYWFAIISECHRFFSCKNQVLLHNLNEGYFSKHYFSRPFLQNTSISYFLLMKQNNTTYVNLTFYEKELFCKHKAVLLILVEKSSKYPSIKLE